MGIRQKIILLFTLLTAVIILILSVLVYIFTSDYIQRDFFQRMTVRAGIAGQAAFDTDDGNIAFYNDIRDKHLQRLPEEKEYFFDGTPPVLPGREAAAISGEIQNQLSATGTANVKKGNTYYVAIVYAHRDKKTTIVLSAVNRAGLALLQELRKNIFIGCFTALGVVALVSWLLSKQIVNPIRNIIRQTQTITASNLHMRLPVRDSHDETADLTQTLNDMLDRLETSFETQSNFLNKAAHELRTPLTAIIGEAELALSKPRSSEEYANALQVISRQAEQLQHHTSSLLELAQAGYNSQEPFMTTLRVDELLLSVKRLIDFTEPGNRVQIDLANLPEDERSITINGSVNLLKLALANIIQNGCKYSHLQPVQVTIEASPTYCIIRVTDHGIGIPEKELRYIFDPFFRASNTTGFKGYGVGLPLAQKIIRLHRGDLVYYSRQGEFTTAVISFPIAG